MSNDLISRSALLESVNYYYTHTPNDSPEHYAYGVALKEIREHPTAFDKEKVITEMKKNSHNFYPSIDHYCLSQKAVDLKNAIEIVEKGGTE